MNYIKISSYGDWVDKRKIFVAHGNVIKADDTLELSPAFVEVEWDAIVPLLHGWVKNFAGDHDGRGILDTIIGMRDVAYLSKDFTRYADKGITYIGKDYYTVVPVMRCFKNEINDKNVTRRQYSYSFGSKLCMNGIQFFVDEKVVILNFRSCDYMKKLPLDLYMIKTLLDDIGFDYRKIYCMFGSLHIYKKDLYKLGNL